MSDTYIARRNHKSPCVLCGEPITKGQSCEQWTTFRRDEPPQDNRIHAACGVEAAQYEWYRDDYWPEVFPLITQRMEASR